MLRNFKLRLLAFVMQWHGESLRVTFTIVFASSNQTSVSDVTWFENNLVLIDLGD